MKPFLKLLAEAYLADTSGPQLDSTCFVFPTRRAAQFFLDYMRRAAVDKKVRILPATLTMGEFCAGMTAHVETTRLDELCILYNAYRGLSTEIPDFDRFRFWGEMILDDFNDADRYLADTSMLFANVRKFKEIASNYLTEEQREIINRYWPDTLPPPPPAGEFWRHITSSDDSDSDAQSKFLRLWEVLGPLYEEFTQRMESEGLTTAGRAVRNAAAKVAQMGADDFPFSRYVFAGFGVLSAAELKIFKRLHTLGIADFYWDCASPLFEISESRAMMFLRKYIREFPPRLDLSAFESGAATLPSVTVTGVPSAIGQAALAGETISSWCKSGIIANPADAADTAVVLADEALFLPIVHALPAAIDTVNVTMGIPMRHTPVATMMHTLVTMQLRARKVKGEYCFYYEDLISLFSHPGIRQMEPEGCNAVIAEIRHKRLFTMSQSAIAAIVPQLAPLFKPVKQSDDFREALDYMRSAVEFMAMRLDDDSNATRRLDLRFMRGYIQAINNLDATVTMRGITIGTATALRLIERTVWGGKIRFEGRPLKGMQILGMGETRALDFRNVILTSMNERIYPRRNALRSFIPDNIRRAFGLPGADFHEAAGAYNFFRLISRAENVTVYYDSRNSGVGASEMSRYVAQLLYLSGLPGMRHEAASFTPATFAVPDLSVAKTPAVMAKLSRFLIDGDDRLNLSASAINAYINCPLSFYLSTVEQIRIDDEEADYMDSSTYGTIVHQVAENIYNDLRGPREEVTVTADALQQVIDNRAYIDRLITRAVNRHHNHAPTLTDDTPLSGETRVLGNLIRSIISEMLRREKEMAPFTFVAAEWKRKLRYEAAPGLTVNMTMVIDRIDHISDGHYRFIDYKTGNDRVRFTSLDDLFNPGKSDRCKAVLQLMLYANLHSRLTHFTGPVQPMIYQLKTLFTEGLTPIQYGKEVFADYRTINEEFLGRLNGVISEIFNPDVPFTQSENPHSCTYCAFRALCGREDF